MSLVGIYVVVWGPRDPWSGRKLEYPEKANVSDLAVITLSTYFPVQFKIRTFLIWDDLKRNNETR